MLCHRFSFFLSPAWQLPRLKIALLASQVEWRVREVRGCQHSATKFQLRMCFLFGRGCGLVVSVLAYYSDDPGSNPA